MKSNKLSLAKREAENKAISQWPVALADSEQDGFEPLGLTVQQLLMTDWSQALISKRKASMGIVFHTRYINGRSWACI